MQGSEPWTRYAPAAGTQAGWRSRTMPPPSLPHQVLPANLREIRRFLLIGDSNGTRQSIYRVLELQKPPERP